MTTLAESLCAELLTAGSANTLTSPTDKVAEMRSVIDVLKAAGDAAATRYATAMESFLADEGSCLETKLGLKPPRGGRLQTVWAQQFTSEKQSRLRDIAATIPGDLKKKASTISKCAKAIYENENIEEDSFDDLKKLIVESGFKIPTTEWRIARIVK